jgi:hypothetical protein
MECSRLKILVMKKNIINILVVVTFIIIVFCFLPNRNDVNCKLYKDFIDLDICGTVVDKYYDKSQHSYPTIEVKSLYNNSIQKVNLEGEVSDLYNLLSKLDTISKAKQSDIILRKEKGIFVRLIKADFDCVEKNH